MTLRIDLVERSAIDAQQLVDLINRAYKRYEILCAPRITLEQFRAEAQAGVEFLLAFEAKRVLGCAMVCSADRYFESAEAAASTKPGWLAEDGSRPCQGSSEFSVLPYCGELSDALYFGLAAADRGRQNRGVGRSLLARAEGLASERGYERVVLTTVREFGLQDYYERFGYQLAGAEPYPAGHWSLSVPHHLCYMEKPLRAIVRTAVPADVTAITALVNLSYEVEQFFVDGDRTDEAEVARSLARGDFLLLEKGDALVGAVDVWREGGIGHFGMLSVAPSHQAKGHGARLVAEAETYLRVRGARAVEILVVDRREPLFPWYGRLGYKPAGSEPYVCGRPTKVPVHFVVMRKELAPAGAVEV